MNNMWKRATSLILSGVLLMGSLPVQVWANTPGDSGMVADAEVLVDGTPVENNEKISYADGKLTLNGVSITATGENCGIKTTIPLQIELNGENTIEAEAVAIFAESDLTITGTGSLKVTTSNATAISVAGSVDDEENEKGLTIGGVQLDVRTTYVKPQNPEPKSTLPDAPIGIDSVNGVVIEGAAHFKTSHSKSDTQYALVRGYHRTSKGNPFVDAMPTWTSDGGAFEFVADEHLEWVYADEDKHELNCKNNGVENCILNQTAIASGKHSVGEAAGCGSKIKCGVCEGYYGDPVAEHKGTKTLVPVEDGKHDEKYSECGHFVGDPQEHTFNSVALSEEKTVLTVKCECGAEDTERRVTLEAPQNLIWDNSEKRAVVTPADKTVKYYSVDEAGIETVLGEDKYPVEPGKYAAKVDVKIGEETYALAVTYTILGASVTDEMVTLSTESVTYDGQVKTLPEVTVGALVKGTDYEVAFTRNGAPVDEAGRTNAGEIVVTVTGKGNYSGTGTKMFKILQAEATASEFKYTAPANLTYNGQPKVATIETNNTVMGMGDTEVKYYKNGTLTEQCIDVGTYEARVYVKGTGNYAQKEVQNNWSFGIVAANVGDEGVCTVSVEDKQTVGTGLGEFAEPTFTGYTKAGADQADQLTGTITYTYDTDHKTTEVIATINEYLSGLTDGTTVKIGYTFTPALSFTNYTGTTQEREVTVTNTTLTVKNDGTAGNAATIGAAIKATDPKYGDLIVDVSKLSAHIGESSDDTDENFTVKYSKFTGGAYADPVAMEKPDAGSYKFYVYYNNANLGGIAVKDALVASGDVNIGKKTPAIMKDKPVAEILVANGTEQPLLKAGKEGKTDDGDALEYCLTENGTYNATVPTATEAGYYEVWYQSPSNDNYTTPAAKGKVQVLVVPYLTATYEQTLDDVKPQLTPGFTFNAAAHPKLDATVGNAGEHKVKLDYTHPNDKAEVADDYPTLTGYEVTLKVSPKKVTPTMTLNVEAYDQNEDGYVSFSSATKSDLFIVTVGEKKLVYNTDYTVTATATTDGLKGYHEIKPKDGSNYTFDPVKNNPAVNLYRADHSELKEENFPEEALEATEYETLDKAKKALTDKLKADGYPEEYMAFFKVYLMKQVGASLKDNQWQEYMEAGMFPPKGLTYVIPYTDLSNAKETDEFKVAVLYLAGDHAGKIVELEKAKDYDATSTGLKIALNREAIVCVAKQVDLTQEYDITKSIVLDGKTSTQGSLTIKVDDKAVAKATYGKTVKVTATAKSGYSVEKVTVTDASGNAVTLDKKSEGNYEFRMPASKVTVKLSLKKTTSSTKNPGSGDSSNIHLWTAILAFSGVGIAALAALLFWKRRK